MPTDDVLDVEETLLYLSHSKGFNWFDINTAMSTKEEFDIAKAKAAVIKLKDAWTKAGYSMTTIMSDEYPAEITGEEVPLAPYAMVYKGDPKLLVRAKKEWFVFAEDALINKQLDNRKILHGTYDTSADGLGELIISDGENTFQMRDAKESADARLLEMCNVLVYTKGDPDFIRKNSNFAGVKYFAIVGAPGSECNQLIKRGEATLCDSTSDLLSK